MIGIEQLFEEGLRHSKQADLVVNILGLDVLFCSYNVSPNTKPVNTWIVVSCESALLNMVDKQHEI